MSTVTPSFQDIKSRPISSARSQLSLLRRALKPIFVVAFASFLAYQLQYWVGNRLGNDAFATGYTLLATILALSFLGVRKRLPGMSLGPVAIWQTTHHYLGCFCLVAYCLHARIIATGWLEGTLAILFWFIILTGFFSWYVNRSSPRLLQAAGKAILRNDIPEARVAIAEEAYQLALEAAGSPNAFVIADYYQAKLNQYFSTPRSLVYRILPTGKHRRDLQYQLGELTRYLDENGQVMQSRMIRLVQRRDDLDFQSAILNRIRVVATVHTLLLGAFIVFTAGHVVVAHLYSSHW